MEKVSHTLLHNSYFTAILAPFMLLLYITNSSIIYLSTSMAIYSVITCLTTLIRQIYLPWPHYSVDKATKRVISVFVPLHHASYFFYSGTKAFPSALITIDNGCASLTDLNPVHAYELSMSVLDLPSTEVDELSYSSLLHPILHTIPKKSPLYPYLPSSTASFRMSAQVLLRVNDRTQEERTASYACSIATRAKRNPKLKKVGKQTSHGHATKMNRANDAKAMAAGLPTSHQTGVRTRQENNIKSKAAGKEMSYEKRARTQRIERKIDDSGKIV
ncbi:hypothetical protein JCM5296_001817 [Sporobolomyces johnsonii]